MAALRHRSAVSPVRRGQPAPALAPRPTVDEVVADLRPAEPLHCLRPHTLRETARRFTTAFAEAVGGHVLYAVKCNPDPMVIRNLVKGGVRQFDCASPGEVRLIRSMVGDAPIRYMHPVKNRAAIRETYEAFGVRDYALDSLEELEKLKAETGGGSDLGLIVRLAVNNGAAVYALANKFGATPEVGAELLRRARAVGARVGVSFHVGSQCLDPAAYTGALALAGEVIRAAGVPVDVVDVGGGFPVHYPGEHPPPLEAYMGAIRDGVEALDLPPGAEIWAEPGRALVGAGTSVVVQVERRRGDALYINDGKYGSLHDASLFGTRHPCRLIRPGRPASTAPEVPFVLWGPTCDSVDTMKGPFLIPADVGEGDWIEIGQLGAYGATLRTGFNGFDKARIVEVRDPPLLTTPGYDLAESPSAPTDVA